LHIHKNLSGKVIVQLEFVIKLGDYFVDIFLFELVNDNFATPY